MDGTTVLYIGIGVVFGFLLGWLVEWRIDVSFWNSHVAQLNRREAARRVQAEKEIEEVQLEAEQQLADLRRQLTTEIAELRVRSEEQVAAVRAKTETIPYRPK